LKEFYIAVLALVKDPLWQQSENMQVSGPQTDQIKGCLGGGLRSQSASIFSLNTNI